MLEEKRAGVARRPERGTTRMFIQILFFLSHFHTNGLLQLCPPFVLDTLVTGRRFLDCLSKYSSPVPIVTVVINPGLPAI